MPDTACHSDNPLYWPLADLIAAYARRELSPVEVLEQTLARIDAFNPALNAFLGRTDELALSQAKSADDAYRSGNAGPLSGVPVSIKDTFQIAGHATTFGSQLYRTTVSSFDSGVVGRLRASGAVFAGRTNTAEFGQSATTENRFFPDVCNPWDVTRTTGGSSGGAAASVLAGLSSIALGADGGGSIRIPAAFAGLVGLKPTYGLCKNEQGLAAMSDFICPGPLGWCVDDARRMLSVLANHDYSRASTRPQLRIAWCSHPERRPIDPAVARLTQAGVEQIMDLGHQIDEHELPLDGWDEVFGPLVLYEENQQRGQLLERADELTDYERKTLLAAEKLREADVDRARSKHDQYRRRIHDIFNDFDFIITPTTAVPPFTIGDAPRRINDSPVSRTWGAYPFTAAFNVSGNPAVTIPCGFAEGLPIGLQLVGPMNNDAELLDFAGDVEQLLCYDRQAIIQKWALTDIDTARAAGRQ